MLSFQIHFINYRNTSICMTVQLAEVKMIESQQIEPTLAAEALVDPNIACNIYRQHLN